MKEIEGWLLDRGAHEIPHADGSLFEHLCRVRDRLAGHGLSEPEQRAGLTHAAYGTDGFATALLDVADRAELRDLVGPAAEAMVYRYGGCDRGRTWRALATTGEIRSRFTGHVEAPTRDELRAFADLCIVNELDVCERSAEVFERAGGYFHSLFPGWAAVASPAVLDDFVTCYQRLARRSRQGRPSGS